MQVGITGATGFLGWHVRARLMAEGVRTVGADRATMADPDALDEFVRSSDCLVHLAGVNRAASDAEIEAGNRDLADRLAAALDRTKSTAPLVFSNSIQNDRDNAYGRSKRYAASLLADNSRRRNAPFLDLVLPHVFGEFGRPNYNSAVATFAHAMATGDEADVNRSGQLELVHAQAVAARVLEFVRRPAGGCERLRGRPTNVGDVWDLLERHHARYVEQQTVPAFADEFELRIFNTFRAQLFLNGHYPIAMTPHRDERGFFAELMRADGLGQTSISTSGPGILRGDHFHFEKVERFVVVDGHAEIKLRRVLTDDIQTFEVSGDVPVAIDMPTLTTHNIRNVGSGVLTTVFWAGDHFDPANTDTFVDPVEATAP